VNPDLNSPLMKDEIFGPILPILTYKSIDEAIHIINSKEKPLTLYYFGGVFSKNYTKIERETSSGSLVMNETLF